MVPALWMLGLMIIEQTCTVAMSPFLCSLCCCRSVKREELKTNLNGMVLEQGVQHTLLLYALSIMNVGQDPIALGLGC